MKAYEILSRHIDVSSRAFYVLSIHSVLVTRKALKLAKRYKKAHPDARIDTDFLEEIGMLHDIGIVKVMAPDIGCHGEDPYICHGVRGREILEEEGLERHALACERHTGAGITKEEVRLHNLPIPGDRDYLPLSLEEKILCVADKFFGKKSGKLWREKSPKKIERQFERLGETVLERWRRLYREICG